MKEVIVAFSCEYCCGCHDVEAPGLRSPDMDVTLTVMTWQINRNLIQRLADTRTSSGSYILRCFREYRNIICFYISHLRSGDSLLGYPACHYSYPFERAASSSNRDCGIWHIRWLGSGTRHCLLGSYSICELTSGCRGSFGDRKVVTFGRSSNMAVLSS